VAPSLPAGWTVRPPVLDDIPAILAVAHASDFAAVGEPDWTSDEVREVLTASAFDPLRDSWLAFDGSGRLAAWAYLDNPTTTERDLVDVYAHPEFGHPAQAPLLALAMARVAERARAWGYDRLTLRAGAIPTEEHYIGVLRAAGFEFVKRYARMRRELTGSERPPQLPPGVRIRPLRADDDADLRTFHRIMENAFADTPDYIPHAYESWREWIDGFVSTSWDEWYVAEVDGVPAGALQSSDQSVEQNEGWVKNLAVLGEYRKRGLGAAMLATAFAAYAAKGRRLAGLGVDMTNPTGAYRLYTSAGMAAAYQADVYERTVEAGLR
jgi:ribosomal protein S18 acetylase RimI-like enzyme